MRQPARCCSVQDTFRTAWCVTVYAFTHNSHFYKHTAVCQVVCGVLRCICVLVYVCALPGIKLTGGIGSRWQGIYCLEVVPGSPASEEGSVQPNDKILYICGRCTLGMTLEDAVKACEIAPRKVKLKIIRYGSAKAREIDRKREREQERGRTCVCTLILSDSAVFCLSNRTERTIQ